MLCRYLVLLHSPDTCSSSSSCSDAMRMRVLPAFAAPRSLQDLLLKETLLSLFSLILPLSAFSRGSALAACHRVDALDTRDRELPLALPPRLWGIAHSSVQKRHQVRSARLRRHTAFDNLAPLAEYSADILVPPHSQTSA